MKYNSIGPRGYKFFILSKVQRQVVAVLEETDTTLTFIKLITNAGTKIIPDENYGVRTDSKDGLSSVLDKVELTKDCNTVKQYLSKSATK